MQQRIGVMSDGRGGISDGRHWLGMCAAKQHAAGRMDAGY
jgi:hypothetical protein